MKMAKASEADIDMAMELCGAIDALTSRWPTLPAALMKPDDDGAEAEHFDCDDDRQCGTVLRHLLAISERASLLRVVWGMAVLLDPANKMVDPDADTLEHHPAMLADGARLRWLTEDHADPDTRARCRELLERMPMMSYSAATADIDAAMRECAAVGAA